jgi:hypothetical protein
VGRLLVSGVAAATVVLVTASTPSAREGGPSPRPDTMSFGVDAAVTAPAPQLPPVSVGQAWVKHSKGTPKLPPSALTHLDIPATAIVAYQRAEAVVGQVDASCGLSWTLLAAIGRVESDHGRSGGARLRPDGTSSPAIRGVELDGTGPVARIRDTDGGTLDGDPVWDRAVGPMQILPSTWSVVGVDADGDKVRSPDDINDAALATAVFLCGAAGDLTNRSELRTAVHRYNPSRSYVASVLALDRAYRANDVAALAGLSLGGTVGIVTLLAPGGGPVRPGSTGVVPSGAPRAQRRQASGSGSAPGRHGQHGQQATDSSSAGPGPRSDAASGSDPTGPADPGTADPGTPGPGAADTPAPGAADTPAPGGAGTPAPATGTPDPAPDPGPSATPSPPPPSAPAPVPLTGVLTACGTGWCLDQLSLDVGDAAFLAATSSADFDADGAVESNGDELTGLAGTEVSVLVASDAPPARVLSVNGVTYAGG